MHVRAVPESGIRRPTRPQHQLWATPVGCNGSLRSLQRTRVAHAGVEGFHGNALLALW